MAEDDKPFAHRLEAVPDSFYVDAVRAARAREEDEYRHFSITRSDGTTAAATTEAEAVGHLLTAACRESFNKARLGDDESEITKLFSANEAIQSVGRCDQETFVKSEVWERRQGVVREFVTPKRVAAAVSTAKVLFSSDARKRTMSHAAGALSAPGDDSSATTPRPEGDEGLTEQQIAANAKRRQSAAAAKDFVQMEADPHSFVSMVDGVFLHVWHSARAARRFSTRSQRVAQAIFEHRLQPLAVPPTVIFATRGITFTMTALCPLPDTSVPHPSLHTTCAGALTRIVRALTGTDDPSLPADTVAAQCGLEVGADGHYYVMSPTALCAGIGQRCPWELCAPTLRPEPMHLVFAKGVHGLGRAPRDIPQIIEGVCVPNAVKGFLQKVEAMGEPKFADVLGSNALGMSMRQHGVNISFLHAVSARLEAEQSPAAKLGVDAAHAEMVFRTVKQIIRAEAQVHGQNDATDSAALGRVNRLMQAIAAKDPAVWGQVLTLLREKFCTPPEFDIAVSKTTVRALVMLLAPRLGIGFDQQANKMSKFSTATPFMAAFAVPDPVKMMIQKNEAGAAHVLKMDVEVWRRLEPNGSPAVTMERMFRLLRLAFIAHLMKNEKIAASALEVVGEALQSLQHFDEAALPPGDKEMLFWAQYVAAHAVGSYRESPPVTAARQLYQRLDGSKPSLAAIADDDAVTYGPAFYRMQHASGLKRPRQCETISRLLHSSLGPNKSSFDLKLCPPAVGVATLAMLGDDPAPFSSAHLALMRHVLRGTAPNTTLHAPTVQLYRQAGKTSFTALSEMEPSALSVSLKDFAQDPESVVGGQTLAEAYHSLQKEALAWTEGWFPAFKDALWDPEVVVSCLRFLASAIFTRGGRRKQYETDFLEYATFMNGCCQTKRADDGKNAWASYTSKDLTTMKEKMKSIHFAESVAGLLLDRFIGDKLWFEAMVCHRFVRTNKEWFTIRDPHLRYAFEEFDRYNNAALFLQYATLHPAVKRGALPDLTAKRRCLWLYATEHIRRKARWRITHSEHAHRRGIDIIEALRSFRIFSDALAVLQAQAEADLLAAEDAASAALYRQMVEDGQACDHFALCRDEIEAAAAIHYEELQAMEASLYVGLMIAFDSAAAMQRVQLDEAEGRFDTELAEINERVALEKEVLFLIVNAEVIEAHNSFVGEVAALTVGAEAAAQRDSTEREEMTERAALEKDLLLQETVAALLTEHTAFVVSVGAAAIGADETEERHRLEREELEEIAAGTKSIQLSDYSAMTDRWINLCYAGTAFVEIDNEEAAARAAVVHDYEASLLGVTESAAEFDAAGVAILQAEAIARLFEGYVGEWTAALSREEDSARAAILLRAEQGEANVHLAKVEDAEVCIREDIAAAEWAARAEILASMSDDRRAIIGAAESAAMSAIEAEAVVSLTVVVPAMEGHTELRLEEHRGVAAIVESMESIIRADITASYAGGLVEMAQQMELGVHHLAGRDVHATVRAAIIEHWSHAMRSDIAAEEAASQRALTVTVAEGIYGVHCSAAAEDLLRLLDQQAQEQKLLLQAAHESVMRGLRAECKQGHWVGLLAKVEDVKEPQARAQVEGVWAAAFGTVLCEAYASLWQAMLTGRYQDTLVPLGVLQEDDQRAMLWRKEARQMRPLLQNQEAILRQCAVQQQAADRARIRRQFRVHVKEGEDRDRIIAEYQGVYDLLYQAMHQRLSYLALIAPSTKIITTELAKDSHEKRVAVQRSMRSMQAQSSVLFASTSGVASPPGTHHLPPLSSSASTDASPTRHRLKAKGVKGEPPRQPRSRPDDDADEFALAQAARRAKGGATKAQLQDGHGRQRPPPLAEFADPSDGADADLRRGKKGPAPTTGVVASPSLYSDPTTGGLALQPSGISRRRQQTVRAASFLSAVTKLMAEEQWQRQQLTEGQSEFASCCRVEWGEVLSMARVATKHIHGRSTLIFALPLAAPHYLASLTRRMEHLSSGAAAAGAGPPPPDFGQVRRNIRGQKRIVVRCDAEIEELYDEQRAAWLHLLSAHENTVRPPDYPHLADALAGNLTSLPSASVFSPHRMQRDEADALPDLDHVVSAQDLARVEVEERLRLERTEAARRLDYVLTQGHIPRSTAAAISLTTSSSFGSPKALAPLSTSSPMGSRLNVAAQAALSASESTLMSPVDRNSKPPARLVPL